MTDMPPVTDILSSPLARELMVLLNSSWPMPLTVKPSALKNQPGHRAFVTAIVGLQDDGLIMTEAMLIGADAEPKILNALITRRGQERMLAFQSLIMD